MHLCEEAGRPLTKKLIASFVFDTLEERKTHNHLVPRFSTPLNTAAHRALRERTLPDQWFTLFFDRHPSVHRVHADDDAALEPAMAITPATRDELFERRKSALIRTGILDPATGLVDTSRIANWDECTLNMDGVGNTLPIRQGLFKKLLLTGS